MGLYASADDLVRAGLATLEQMEKMRAFAPQQWNGLLKEGEESIQREEKIDARQFCTDLEMFIPCDS